MRITPILAAGGLAALMATAAPAQSLVDGSNPNAVLEVAQIYGSASLSTDAHGDPMIEAQMGDNEYAVFFYDCEGGRNCKAIQFWTWFAGTGATQDKMRSWNQTERFGKAYLDRDGDPNIEWDVNLRHGVSTANLNDSFDWWRIVLDNFAAHVRN